MNNYKKALKQLITNGIPKLQKPCERFFKDHKDKDLNEVIQKLTYDKGLEPSEFLYELGYVK